MKKLLTILAFFTAISANAQIDIKISYEDSLIYQIDTTVYYGVGDSSVSPNFVMFNYHYTAPDSTWESQLVITDSIGNWLVPIPGLINAGASGTTWFTKLDSASISKSPLELCDSLFLPKYQLYIGTTTKL